LDLAKSLQNIELSSSIFLSRRRSLKTVNTTNSLAQFSFSFHIVIVVILIIIIIILVCSFVSQVSQDEDCLIEIVSRRTKFFQAFQFSSFFRAKRRISKPVDESPSCHNMLCVAQQNLSKSVTMKGQTRRRRRRSQQQLHFNQTGFMALNVSLKQFIIITTMIDISFSLEVSKRVRERVSESEKWALAEFEKRLRDDFGGIFNRS